MRTSVSSCDLAHSSSWLVGTCSTLINMWNGGEISVLTVIFLHESVL